MEKLKPKILLVSSSEIRKDKLYQSLKSLEPEIELADGGAASLKSLKERSFDIVILEKNITDYALDKLTRKIITKAPAIDLFLALPEEESVAFADFEFFKVDDVVSLPFKEEELELKIKKSVTERNFLKSCGLVGKSDQLKRIAEAVLQVAPTDITVLITGESGTGKELIARAIHNNSARKEKLFMAVNCGAWAEGVLESELFGHEKGAFTGAISRRQGVFEVAGGGSIFLDEIGELKPATQVKLLRVLEERDFMRVGGTEKIKVDVRVIAATNQDLGLAVDVGSFRKDLYYRLAVVKIDVPPLRDRISDIPILVYEFLNQINVRNPRKIFGITDSALEGLLKYHWPGNVRELKNFLESMQVLAPERKIEISDVMNYIEKQGQANRALPVTTGKTVQTAEHELIYQALMRLSAEILALKNMLVTASGLDKFQKPVYPPAWVKESSKEVAPEQSLEDIEKNFIQEILEKTRGNRRKAAKILGIGERTLYRKINKYNLK